MAASATCLVLAVAVWYLRVALGPWPLILVGLGLGVQAWATRRLWTPTPFDLPLALFMLTAVLGVWASYNSAVAWPRFWAIASAVVMFRAVVAVPDAISLRSRRLFSPLRWGFALLPTLIAAYFLVSNDWATWTGGKLPLFDPLRLWLAESPLSLFAPLWHPNVMGGLLAMLAPLQVVALGPWRGKRWLGVFLVILTWLVLFLTASRAAWMGFALVSGGWLFWRLDKNFVAMLLPKQRRVFWGILTIILVVLAILAMASIPCDQGCQEAIAGRTRHWRGSVDLAFDTPFTGLGFGAYQMALSSYVMLLHVGFVLHSHSFFLQLWLEQGVLGLVALLALVITAARWADKRSAWHVAALMSLGAILIHGIFDIPLYADQGAPLLFVPFALLARPTGLPARTRLAPRWTRILPIRLAWATIPFLILIVLLLPGSRSAFLTNLGAVAQMKAELSVYRWPDWGIQDAVRRSPDVNMRPTIAYYEAALALNPHNAAANRRLGQIELSLGEYDAAHQHLQAAYAVAPGQQATRHLLGESYAIAGDIDHAAALWRTIGGKLWWDTNWVGPQTFQIRKYWYQSIGETQKVRWIEDAIERASEP